MNDEDLSGSENYCIYSFIIPQPKKWLFTLSNRQYITAIESKHGINTQCKPRFVVMHFIEYLLSHI